MAFYGGSAVKLGVGVFILRQNEKFPCGDSSLCCSRLFDIDWGESVERVCSIFRIELKNKMAQQQTEIINDIANNENAMLNDSANKNLQQNGSNMDTTNNKNMRGNPAGSSNMNEQQKVKSPPGPGANGNGGPPPPMPQQMTEGMIWQPNPHAGMPVTHDHMQGPPPQGPPYGRYDPNMPPTDMYGRAFHPGGKPAAMVPPPNRPPPQRYMPGPGPGPVPVGQQQTPTLNSLLQSAPPPPHQVIFGFFFNFCKRQSCILASRSVHSRLDEL